MSFITLRQSATLTVPMQTLSGLAARIAAMVARRRTDRAIATLNDRLRADIGLAPQPCMPRPDIALWVAR